jgi:glycosyltransferase involved in cell wall biosynthesis
VIPAYREARYLAASLAAVRAFLDDAGWLGDTELVVVTADAPDDTVAIARRELARFPHHRHVQPGPKVGKGRDVRCGMLAATGELVMFMDADLATPLHHVPRMVAMLRGDSDVVIGCRQLATMHDRWSRKISSQLANLVVRWALVPGVPDTQCGFKGFRRAVARALFEPLATTGWGFDFEVLARAAALGVRVAQLAIPDWHDPKGDDGLVGEPPWRARLRTLGELAAVWAMRRKDPARFARRVQLPQRAVARAV